MNYEQFVGLAPSTVAGNGFVNLISGQEFRYYGDHVARDGAYRLALQSVRETCAAQDGGEPVPGRSLDDRRRQHQHS